MGGRDKHSEALTRLQQRVREGGRGSKRSRGCCSEGRPALVRCGCGLWRVCGGDGDLKGVLLGCEVVRW
jgi:hypothetical protein